MIASAFIKDASAVGINLRNGSSGFVFGDLTLVDANIASESGNLGAKFGNVMMYWGGATSAFPLSLASSTVDVSFGTVHITSSVSPTSGYLAYFNSCDRIKVGSMFLRRVGATLSEGLRITGTSPDIFVGSMRTQGITTPVQQSATNDTNIIINHDDVTIGSGHEWKSKAAIELIARHLATSNSAGDELANYKVYNSDSSGAQFVFQLKTTARGGTGFQGRTEILDDDDSVVGVIREAGGGMTIVPPTSSSGLPTGAIYNNSGSLDIV